jgi:hypothetical protein
VHQKLERFGVAARCCNDFGAFRWGKWPRFRSLCEALGSALGSPPGVALSPAQMPALISSQKSLVNQILSERKGRGRLAENPDQERGRCTPLFDQARASRSLLADSSGELGLK